MAAIRARYDLADGEVAADVLNSPDTHRLLGKMTVMIESTNPLPNRLLGLSRRALDHAMAIARWYGSTVTALHVFSSAPVVASYPGPIVLEPIVVTAVGREELLAQTKAFIDAEAVPGVRVEAVVREGQAAAEIADMAIGMNADLLVIGTHGRSGFERLLLGSSRRRFCARLVAPC